MIEESNLYAFLNKDFVLYQSASLHISDLAIQRGYGVFDFTKVQDNKALFLSDYLDRFYMSAAELNLDVPYSKKDLHSIVYQLIYKNNLSTSGIKIILTGGYSENGYDSVNPNLLIIQQPLVLPTPDMIEHGIKIISHEYVRELPRVKSINYTMGIRLQKKIKEAGATEVLYHKKGIVSEFPRCNFFIVTQDNTVVTPSNNILHGITRKNVLSLATVSYNVEERDITLKDIFEAKEAFLTSTTKRILPIIQLDNIHINDGKPGNITLGLLSDLIGFERKAQAE